MAVFGQQQVCRLIVRYRPTVAAREVYLSSCVRTAVILGRGQQSGARRRRVFFKAKTPHASYRQTLTQEEAVTWVSAGAGRLRRPDDRLVRERPLREPRVH